MFAAYLFTSSFSFAFNIAIFNCLLLNYFKIQKSIHLVSLSISDIIKFFSGVVKQHNKRTIAILTSVNLPTTKRYIILTQKVIQKLQSNGFMRKLLGEIFKYFPIATFIEWTNPLISITNTQIISIENKSVTKPKMFHKLFHRLFH